MRSATGSFRSGLVLGVAAASARRSSWLLRTPVVGALALLTQLLTVSRSEAQLQNAQVQGTISDARSRKALTGATVTITGPAIPELQAEITDARGHYLITQLPPGDDYVIRIYYGGAEEPQLVRTGLRLSVGKTVTVDANLRTSQQPSDVKVIVEKAPNLDTASATTGVEVNQELLRHTPQRGRTFESALALAPATANVAPRNFNGGNGSVNIPGSEVGVSISGATGAENSYLIDGVNTTDPASGVIGAQVSQYFIKEMNVLTGGYQPEYGRATGGVISIITKSGSNELHGGIYGSIVPLQLSGQSVARLGEAIVTRTRPEQNSWDVAADLGGALWRDRIWFYAGLAVTSQSVDTERRGRRQLFDATTGSAAALADFSCPSYLASSQYCVGPRKLALKTEELDYAAQFTQSRRIYNGIAKLQLHLATDHDLYLQYLASPSTLSSYTAIGSGDVASKGFSEVNQVHDASLRYIGKLFQKQLQVELLYGFHYQSQTQSPTQPEQEQYNLTASADAPFSLADFEAVAPCRPQQQNTASGAVLFNPCPVTSYGIGVGFYREQVLQRHQALAAFTLFVHALGLHAIKAGVDFQFLRNDSSNIYVGKALDPADPTSGRRFFNSNADGSDLLFSVGFGGRDAMGNPVLLDRFHAVTDNRSYGVYLRDSYSVGPVPGLVVNLGVRWDGQELLDTTGTVQLSVLHSFAPRVGLVYDFTQLTRRPGRSKVFFNYGRFFESIPADVGERAFSNQGLLVSFPSGCPQSPRQDGGRPIPRVGAGCDLSQGFLAGGNPYQTLPGLKAPTTDEIVAGIQVDVGADLLLGASYIYRELTNAFDDLSLDGANYFLANPGVPVEAGVVKQLSDDVARLEATAAAAGATEADRKALANAQSRLAAYNAFALFPRAVRTYNALVLTANKRLSSRVSVLASYTYSRTLGNYPGIYSGNNGQLNPHTSTQFDYLDLLANRTGPLPTDRPHNFKVTGFYQHPILTRGTLTAGLTFTAISGRPIEVLGAHANAGPGEVFILPRGSGGRTPTVTQLDLHVGYDHRLGKSTLLGLYLDVINLANQREVLNVDDIYTSSTVGSILNGQAKDLAHLKTPDGTEAIYNSNYGQPTAFQAPLYLRTGARLTF